LLAPQTEEQRLHAWVFGLFAALSVLLAAVGLYGTLSYQVRLRRREFGIRLAVGARATTLLRGVAFQGLRLVALGVVLGLGAALLARHAVASLLFDLSPTDPLTLTAVTALLLLVVLLASWFPARRATRVDPMTVLREE
jgi:ABC-type antimicrobial peptide transport system permease subunit